MSRGLIWQETFLKCFLLLRYITFFIDTKAQMNSMGRLRGLLFSHYTRILVRRELFELLLNEIGHLSDFNKNVKNYFNC